MHRENDLDVINAKKALETICKNNSNYRFEIEDYDNYMFATNVEPNSGNAGSVFSYSSNGMYMSVAISDKTNQVSISSELKEKQDWFFYYTEYQRLHKLLQNLLNESKLK